MQKLGKNCQTQEVPIIDIGPYVRNQANTKQVAQALRKVLKDVGFFYIKNHGMPKELQDNMIKYMDIYFKLPKEEKNKIHMTKNLKSGMGYFGFKEEITFGKSDLKEGLYVGQILQPTHPKVLSNYPIHGNNFFPEKPEGFAESIIQYMKHVNRIGDNLLQAISQSLNLEKSYFKEKICSETGGYISMMKYPCNVQHCSQLQSISEHTDYGFLVILLANDKGLEVKNRKGEWIDVDPIQDTFIINVGDVLEKMTQNLYRSTPHRVRKPKGRDRYSIPFFFDPGWDVQIKQIPFEFSEEQKAIMERTRKEKRVDDSKVQDIYGKYGKYLMEQMSINFPLVTQFQEFYDKELLQEKMKA